MAENTTYFCSIREVYVNVFTTYVAGFTPIIMSGLVLNCLTIVVFSRFKEKPNSVFLLQLLAICDICYLMVCFIYFPGRHLYLYIMYGDYVFRRDDWYLSPIILAVADPLYYVTLFQRNWTIVIICAERFASLYRPLWAKAVITKRILIRCFAAMFFAVSAIRIARACFVILGPKIDPCTGETVIEWIEMNASWEVFDRLFMAIGLIILPQLMIYVLNLALIISLRRSFESRAQMTQSSKQDDKIHLQATAMVIGMAVVFTVFETPSCIDRFMLLAGWNPPLFDEVRQYIRRSNLFLSTLDSTVNFAAYAISNRAFRGGARALFSLGTHD